MEPQKRHPILCHSAPVFVPLPKHREYIANRLMKCWRFYLTQSSNREGVIYVSKPEGKKTTRADYKNFRGLFSRRITSNGKKFLESLSDSKFLKTASFHGLGQIPSFFQQISHKKANSKFYFQVYQHNNNYSIDFSSTMDECL